MNGQEKHLEMTYFCVKWILQSKVIKLYQHLRVSLVAVGGATCPTETWGKNVKRLYLLAIATVENCLNSECNFFQLLTAVL